MTEQYLLIKELPAIVQVAGYPFKLVDETRVIQGFVDFDYVQSEVGRTFRRPDFIGQIGHLVSGIDVDQKCLVIAYKEAVSGRVEEVKAQHMTSVFLPAGGWCLLVDLTRCFR